MSKKGFAHTNQAHASITATEKGRTLFVSSPGYTAIWCKQIRVRPIGNHPKGTSVMQISAQLKKSSIE
jgi:hypothetical protein